jgi:hypothetical protein
MYIILYHNSEGIWKHYNNRNFTHTVGQVPVHNLESGHEYVWEFLTSALDAVK